MGQSCWVQHTPHIDAVHFLDAKFRHFGQWTASFVASGLVLLLAGLLLAVVVVASLDCDVFWVWLISSWELVAVVVAS